MTLRAEPIYGEYEDAKRYYRCRNCGFICDTQTNFRTLEATRTAAYGPAYLLLESGDYFLKEDGGKVIIGYSGESGSYEDLTIGCPFCGVANYK